MPTGGTKTEGEDLGRAFLVEGTAQARDWQDECELGRQGSVGGAGALWAWPDVMRPQIQFHMWDPFPCGKGLVRLSFPP